MWFTLARDARRFSTLKKQLVNIHRLLATEKANNKSKSKADHIATYRQLLKQSILQNALAEPKNFSGAAQQRAWAFLKQYKNDNHAMLLACDRFQVAIEGSAVIQQQVQQQVQNHLNQVPKTRHGQRLKRFAEQDLKIRLTQTAQLIKDNKARAQWLQSLMKSIPPNKAVVTKKGQKIFSGLYEQLFISLQNSYRTKPRNKQGLKELEKLRKKLVAFPHGALDS
ncbi:MAG: hypothetical protein HRT88_04810 [Lentisphaeraceae bacterium]|nr:hypothetical protein [Lentisphaeraceae bacterium]